MTAFRDPSGRPARSAAGASAEVTPAARARLVERLLLVPDEARSFLMTAGQARAEFGVDDRLLTVLTVTGLCRPGPTGGVCFDRADVQNVSLNLAGASIIRLAMRSWRGSLRRIATAGAVRARVTIEARCTGTHPAGDCRRRLVLPRTLASRVTASDGRRASLVLTAEHRHVLAPGRVRPLLERLSELEFFYLPRNLADRAGFARRTGLADCAAAAGMLLEAAQAGGWPARPAFGLLLAEPYTTLHFWTELADSTGWYPVDPLLLAALARWSRLPRHEWPAWRSTSGLVVRLGEQLTPFAVDGDEPAAVSMPTVLRPVGDGGP